MLIGLVLIPGCGWFGGGASELTVDDDLLSRYHAMAHPAAQGAVSDQIDCYLDYSSGMGEGMRATAATNNSLKNFLGGRKVTYYKVGAVDTPTPIDISSPAANLIDLNNYREAGSKLKVALDRMMAEKSKVSIFITDFERVEDVSLRQQLPGAPAPHPIDASAWGQTQFKEWLLAGNRIDIFAAQFAKPDYWFDKRRSQTYSNWLYTIVFTPGAIVKDEAAFRASVVPFLSELYKDGPVTKHFAYSAAAFDVQQSPRPESGNANQNVVVYEPSTKSFHKGFELYQFNSDDLVNFNTDSALEDKRLINRVRVTPGESLLSEVEFGIKVLDVTEPLTELYMAATQAPPQTVTNVETGQTTTNNKPIVQGYKPGSPNDTIFDLVYNIESHEVGIKLKPDFSGVQRSAVFKVDVVLKSSRMKDSAAADRALTLNYANAYSIRSLADSIRLAVRDVAPTLQDKVVHTFYIKINTN